MALPGRQMQTLPSHHAQARVTASCRACADPKFGRCRTKIRRFRGRQRTHERSSALACTELASGVALMLKLSLASRLESAFVLQAQLSIMSALEIVIRAVASAHQKQAGCSLVHQESDWPPGQNHQTQALIRHRRGVSQLNGLHRDFGFGRLWSRRAVLHRSPPQSVTANFDDWLTLDRAKPETDQSQPRPLMARSAPLHQ